MSVLRSQVGTLFSREPVTFAALRNNSGAILTRNNRFRGSRGGRKGEIQLQFKLAPCNNESCRFCDTRYAWAVRRVVLAETSGLRAREEDSIARNALPFFLSLSLALSPSLLPFMGENDFRRSMQNIRPAVPTRVIRGRSVKPSSGNLYNHPRLSRLW